MSVSVAAIVEFGNVFCIMSKSFREDWERYVPVTFSHTYSSCVVCLVFVEISTNNTPLIGRGLLSTPLSLCFVGINHSSGMV